MTPEDLLLERTSVCYVGGRVFDDLVLGATGQIEFVCLDSKLSAALAKAHKDITEAKIARFPFPEWIEEASYQVAAGKKGTVVFLARLEAFKPWDMDPTQIFVGGYNLTKNDVFTSSMTNPFGEVESGETGTFAFAVPSAEVKAGYEISMGYGEFGVKWRVPK